MNTNENNNLLYLNNIKINTEKYTKDTHNDYLFYDEDDFFDENDLLYDDGEDFLDDEIF